MFQEVTNELADLLNSADKPIPVDDARETVSSGDLVFESALSQSGHTTERDGTEFLTGLDDGPSVEFGGSSDESDDTSDSASETVSEGSDDEEDPDDSEASGIAPEPAVPPQNATEVTLYDLGGIDITHDPEKELVGEPTGEDWNGVPVLADGHDKVPTASTAYMPVEIEPGNRDSEEWMTRVLGGETPRPLLFVGDAGCGKNTAFSHLAAQTNRPTQRINFGSDVSVFDLVGEKEIGDGVTYYILGDLAVAAAFGHFAILDEVNMVTGDVSSFLHGLAEEPGDRSLELRGTEVTLTDIPVSDEEREEHGGWYSAARAKWDPDQHLGRYIHPEFRVAATANPISYSDTKMMNSAFRDRFVVVDHPYLDAKGERALLADETGVDPSDVAGLVRVANTLRQARSQSNAIETPIGHRPLVQTVDMAGPDESWMSFREAALTVLPGKAQQPNAKTYIADTIRDNL